GEPARPADPSAAVVDGSVDGLAGRPGGPPPVLRARRLLIETEGGLRPAFLFSAPCASAKTAALGPAKCHNARQRNHRKAAPCHSRSNSSLARNSSSATAWSPTRTSARGCSSTARRRSYARRIS